jgi:hypothetical protein
VWRAVGITALVIAAVVAFFVFILPHSTSGVIGEGLLQSRLPPGETLVLNGAKELWFVTYDGDNTVTFRHGSLLYLTHKETICEEVGCTKNAWVAFVNLFPVTRNADGTVSLSYPLGFVKL